MHLRAWGTSHRFIEKGELFQATKIFVMLTCLEQLFLLLDLRIHHTPTCNVLSAQRKETVKRRGAGVAQA